ncbi:uncharacterized protein V1518DRAFT_417764 [Limtongia smithiae]|uniref:uncharacterized protein n=1 Tax=Limtongia smithiae TaxID=1125753 RepID=UPI0034CEB5BC
MRYSQQLTRTASRQVGLFRWPATTTVGTLTVLERRAAVLSRTQSCSTRDYIYGGARRTYATVIDTAELLKKSSTASGSTANTRRLSKKLWEKANVTTTEEGHRINLDKRTIKTSSGHPLIVPHDKTALAHLIVQEWATLPSLQIKPHSLPLTSLAARAIDLAKDEESEALREKIATHLLPYLDTDTMLIFAPTQEYNGKLRQSQEEAYRPVIAWAEKTFFDGEKLNYSDGDQGLTGNCQSETVRTKAKAWVMGLDVWQLTAFERAVLGGKSFLGGMQVVEKLVRTRELAEAVTLEVVYQMRRWGEVEDSHDVDWADLRRQLGSAAVLLIED